MCDGRFPRSVSLGYQEALNTVPPAQCRESPDFFIHPM